MFSLKNLARKGLRQGVQRFLMFWQMLHFLFLYDLFNDLRTKVTLILLKHVFVCGFLPILPIYKPCLHIKHILTDENFQNWLVIVWWPRCWIIRSLVGKFLFRFTSSRNQNN